ENWEYHDCSNVLCVKKLIADLGTHGSKELDEDAAKLESMGQDAGPALEYFIKDYALVKLLDIVVAHKEMTEKVRIEAHEAFIRAKEAYRKAIQENEEAIEQVVALRNEKARRTK